MPTSGPPARMPDSAVMVPTSCSMPRALSVNSAPPWQKSQPSFSNSALPATPSAVSEPSGLR